MSCKAQWQRENWRGENSPNYGRTHSAESRRKIGAANSGVGPLSRRWKGGRRISEDGYILIHRSSLDPAEHGKLVAMFTHGNKQYIPEHRLVMARHLRRPLSRREHVHHINGVKTDNRRENLEVLSNGAHRLKHVDAEAEIRVLRQEVERLRLLLEAAAA